MIEINYMKLMFICTLLGVCSFAVAQQGKKLPTYYVYADTVAFYERPDVNATPIGYYYFGDTIEGGKPTGISLTLPLLASYQFDQEYWDGEMGTQPNDLTDEWVEQMVNGNRVYIPGQGISTLPMPPFGDDAGYLMFEERVKQWLKSYAGEPRDSLHTLLPEMPEGDIHEKYELTYSDRAELSVLDEYDTYGMGSTFISLYLPDVRIAEAYWLAIRLYLGTQYADVKWMVTNATANTIRVTNYSEGQTLEISVVKEKDGMRFIWHSGGC